MHTEAAFLGILGYGFACAGFVARRDDVTKKLIVLACLANSAMYVGLGMSISAGVVLLTGLRTAMSIYFRNTRVAMVFIALTISLPFWSDARDWASVAPGITGIVAMYWLSDMSMKAMLVVTSAIWMLINIAHQNWVAVIGESIIIFMGFAGMVRIHSEQKMK